MFFDLQSRSCHFSVDIRSLLSIFDTFISRSEKFSINHDEDFRDISTCLLSGTKKKKQTTDDDFKHMKRRETIENIHEVHHHWTNADRSSDIETSFIGILARELISIVSCKLSKDILFRICI